VGHNTAAAIARPGDAAERDCEVSRTECHRREIPAGKEGLIACSAAYPEMIATYLGAP
jgi:hypothetical protein